MRTDLPAGTVTFLFSDVEGSTRLLEELGADAYAGALAEHRRLLREAFARHGGVEVDTQGDAFFVAFPTADGALAAAAEAQAALANGPIRVRMGIHTGTPLLTAEGYVGPDVHRAARIAAAGHGGQVLLSRETRERVSAEDLTDLGEHRLKDFAEPVWLFQLGAEHFPPLRTISNTNLPRPASPFIGREREVAEITQLLRDGTRLLTLTGPGGTGKTRLAIEAAAELVPEFRNGVFWIGLAALRDPSLVVPTITQTIGARDGLAEFIAEREMLLVLDNLEQVVDVAPELANLVESCPNLRLVATTRELLSVRGEAEYSVPPLSLDEAVELFCRRARAAPDETIAELCRRLDNLPLAIELAAARAAVMSPAQILDRLSDRLDLLRGGRDAEARQATLRATIDWSYELLSADEQRLFARLSAFRGGWTLEATEAVADADLDVLQGLVEKSLVRYADERYSMLETIREYAAAKLANSGEVRAIHSRHAQFFLALAEEAYPNLTGDPKAWLDRLHGEHDNLRAALDRLAQAAESQLPLQLAGALWRFWYQQGHLVEGAQRLTAVLAADAAPSAARARALTGASGIAHALGDLAAAEARARESLALHQRLGDEWGATNARFLLGQVYAARGEWARAQESLEESVEAFRRLGDDHYTLLSLRTLAWMHEEQGDLEGYRALRMEHLKLARATGNKRAVAIGLRFLSGLAEEEQRFADAVALVNEAYETHRQLGEMLELVTDLRALAHILVTAGRPAAATSLIASAEKLEEEVGAATESWAEKEKARNLAIIGSQLDDDALAAAWEQGRTLGPDDVVALAIECV